MFGMYVWTSRFSFKGIFLISMNFQARFLGIFIFGETPNFRLSRQEFLQVRLDENGWPHLRYFPFKCCQIVAVVLLAYHRIILTTFLLYNWTVVCRQYKTVLFIVINMTPLDHSGNCPTVSVLVFRQFSFNNRKQVYD